MGWGVGGGGNSKGTYCIYLFYLKDTLQLFLPFVRTL